eukprot:3523169-Alexandrium_andersonii.AAC.1
MPLRATLLDSLVLSRLLFNAGAWTPLTDSEEKAFTVSYMRCARALTYKEHALSDREVLERTGIVPPRTALFRHRMMYFSRFAQHATYTTVCLVAWAAKDDCHS